jgi:hypothetical protein
LYAKPSLRFIPLTYTPGYFYLAAALSTVLGVGFLPLRLISIAASAGVLAALFGLAAREARDTRAGIMAAGLFAAMYGWTDGWFDLARTDSLFLFLALSAIYVLRWHASTRATIFAAVLISLSFLVKQTGLIVAVPLAAYCAWRGWRVLVGFVGTVSIIVVGTTLMLDRLFGGWYLYYVVHVPGQHPLALETLWGFWRFDLLRPLPLAFLVSVVYLIWRLRSRDRDAAVFYLLAVAGLFGGAMASRLHSLSYINVVLPAYAAVSIVFAIAVHDSARMASARSSARTSRLVPTALYGLALLQLLRLVYGPASLVPSAEDVAAGRQLVQRLRTMPGDVFVPYHGYLPVLAGKTPHAHAAVIADVIRGGVTDVEKGLADELDNALRTHQFDSIVSVDSPTPVRAWLPIEKYYQAQEREVDVRSRFWHPEVRYVPRR